KRDPHGLPPHLHRVGPVARAKLFPEFALSFRNAYQTSQTRTRCTAKPGSAAEGAMIMLGLRSITVTALVTFAVAASPQVGAQSGAPASGSILFQNVRIFDGKGSSLSAPSNVLVKGKIIERISAAPIDVEAGTNVIAGGGRVLMPGLIDAHWHAMLIRT